MKLALGVTSRAPVQSDGQEIPKRVGVKMQRLEVIFITFWNAIAS